MSRVRSPSPSARPHGALANPSIQASVFDVVRNGGADRGGGGTASGHTSPAQSPRLLNKRFASPRSRAGSIDDSQAAALTAAAAVAAHNTSSTRSAGGVTASAGGASPDRPLQITVTKSSPGTSGAPATAAHTPVRKPSGSSASPSPAIAAAAAAAGAGASSSAAAGTGSVKGKAPPRAAAGTPKADAKQTGSSSASTSSASAGTGSGKGAAALSGTGSGRGSAALSGGGGAGTSGTAGGSAGGSAGGGLGAGVSNLFLTFSPVARLSQEQKLQVFSHYDLKRDGALDRAELQVLLAHLFAALTRQLPALLAGQYVKLGWADADISTAIENVLGKIAALNAADVSVQLMSALDLNGDGGVEKSEFAAKYDGAIAKVTASLR